MFVSLGGPFLGPAQVILTIFEGCLDSDVKDCFTANPDIGKKTCLYNFDPLKPHFYIVKLGFIGVYIVFLISAQKH